MQALSSAEFAEVLRGVVPPTGAITDEHLDEYGGLVIHLLLPDWLSFAAGRFTGGDIETSSRLLHVVDRAFRDGRRTSRQRDCGVIR